MTCQKSAVRTYNNAAQAVTAAATQLTLSGTAITRTGCSISPDGNILRINNGGLYFFAADVTITPTEAGTVTVQMYLNGVAMPDAVAQKVVAANGTTTLHVETSRLLAACPCTTKPTISVWISGAAGSVSWVGATAIREA